MILSLDEAEVHDSFQGIWPPRLLRPNADAPMESGVNQPVTPQPPGAKCPRKRQKRPCFLKQGRSRQRRGWDSNPRSPGGIRALQARALDRTMRPLHKAMQLEGGEGGIRTLEGG